jgi:hypothetical protein
MLSSKGDLSLRTLPILLADRIGNFYLCLFLFLSRKVSNAIIKLPKDISKPIIPINIKMISAVVICTTSLLMYSGEPVIKLGRLPPCHGYFSVVEILTYSNRNFNKIKNLEKNKSEGFGGQKT